MRKQKLTQKEAARLIRNCGRTLVVREGEFIVKLHGQAIDHKSTYFTNDLEDAVHTAKSEWGRELAQNTAREYIDNLAKRVEVTTLSSAQSNGHHDWDCVCVLCKEIENQQVKA